jgi:hypothetical protein
MTNIISLKKAKAKKARTANKRTKNKHTFEVGNKKAAGRPPGSLNKFTVEVKDAVVNAAINVGYDGKGEGGLIGYLQKQAKMEPRAFLSLLARCVPVNLVAKVDVEHAVLTPEQVVAKLRERGLPIDQIFKLAPPAVQAKVVEVKANGDDAVEVPVKTVEPEGEKPDLTGIAPPRDTATKH